MIHILASREDFEFVRGNQTVRVPFNTTDPAGATTNTLARQSDIPDISAKRDKTDLAVYRTVAVDEWSIADGRTDILPLTPLDISASPPIGDGEMATAVWVEGGGSISSSDRPPIAIWRIRFTPAGPDSTGDYFVVGVYNPMNHALMRVYSTLFTSGRDYISDPDPASSEPPDELDFGTAADTPVLGTVLMKWRFYKAGVPYPVPDVSLATTNAVVSKSSLAALSGQALSDMATQKEVKIMVQTILSVLQNAARCVALALVVPALALDADTAWEDVPPTNKVKSVVEQFSPPPGNYVTVSNRAMNAVTTNANGAAEIYSRSHALFLRPEEGQIEWEGPDVTAYIGLPKRSGTFALTDDIPDTNGLFYVNKRATLPGGSAYYYGTMWKDGFYSVNLGFEFIATWCDYILPSPEYSEQSVYLASTNYVQKAVAAAATAATNYTHDATKNAVQTNSLGVISASLTIGDGLAVGSGATAYSDPEEGSGAFAHGYLSAATTYDAHAEGSRARAEAEASHAEGVRTTAGGEIASHAAGVRAHASHNASFVWQGTDWAYTNYATLPEYFSHGKGTFNINPAGGLAGFYIGDTNLSGILDEKRGLTNLVVYAADLKAPWYNNNPDYSPLTWNEDAKGWIFSSTTSAGTNSVTLSYATGVWSLHTTFIDGTGKTDTVEAPENATRLDFAYDVVLTRTIPVVATADTLAKASDIPPVPGWALAPTPPYLEVESDPSVGMTNGTPYVRGVALPSFSIVTGAVQSVVSVTSRYIWDGTEEVLYRIDMSGGNTYETPVTNVNALLPENSSILIYLEEHKEEFK